MKIPNPASFRPCPFRTSVSSSASPSTKEAGPHGPRSRHRQLVPSTLAALALLQGAAASQAAPRSEPLENFQSVPGVRELTGRMIAAPLLDSDRPDRTARLIQLGALEHVRRYGLLEERVETGDYLITVPAGRTETEVAQELMETGLFDFVEPDWRVFPIDCPNDPGFQGQWYHRSGRLASCEGWNVTTGSPSVVVAVCDSGLRTTHEDLLHNRVEGYDVLARLWEHEGGSIAPVHEHGTLVTGTAAANGNNGIGVAGVGWNLGFRMIRVSGSPDASALLSDIQRGALVATAAGDRVVSVSYTNVGARSNRRLATYMKSRGTVLVWGAGNSAQRMDWGPRDDDDILVVGGTSSRDELSYFSNYGPSVDLVAPAEAIRTTGATSDQEYRFVSGTSFSTPLVAGLAGLLFSADPDLTPDQVVTRIKNRCDDLGLVGPDDSYGHGRINVGKALALLDVSVVSVTPPEHVVGGVGPRPYRVRVRRNNAGPDQLWVPVHVSIGSPVLTWGDAHVIVPKGGEAEVDVLVSTPASFGTGGQVNTFPLEACVSNFLSDPDHSNDCIVTSVGIEVPWWDLRFRITNASSTATRCGRTDWDVVVENAGNIPSMNVCAMTGINLFGGAGNWSPNLGLVNFTTPNIAPGGSWTFRVRGYFISCIALLGTQYIKTEINYTAGCYDLYAAGNYAQRSIGIR